MFKGVALLEQELIKRVAARASGHLYATLRPRSLEAGNTSVSMALANARARINLAPARRNVASYVGKKNLILNLNSPLSQFTKGTLVLFKEWSLFVASDQNKAKPVS